MILVLDSNKVISSNNMRLAMNIAPIIASTVPARSQPAARSVLTGTQRNGGLWSDIDAVCELLGMPLGEAGRYGRVLFQHRSYRARQRICSAGEKFESLLVVNAGFLRTSQVDESGNEQVLGFPMRGDLVGVEGICAQTHHADTVALTACDVVILPFGQLRSLGHECADLSQVIYRAISRELVHEQSALGVIGTLTAEARVAHFLQELSGRYAALGYSPRRFMLHMTRRDLGSYLGVTLETVSRALSTMAEAGIIDVQKRAIIINDVAALAAISRHANRAKMRAN